MCFQNSPILKENDDEKNRPIILKENDDEKRRPIILKENDYEQENGAIAPEKINRPRNNSRHQKMHFRCDSVHENTQLLWWKT